MIKGFNPFNKSDALFSSFKEQKITHEDKEPGPIKSTDDNLRQRPHKFIDKFRKIALQSISSYRQQRKSINSCNNLLQPEIDLVSIPNGEVKLKGILKNSAETCSYLDLINEPCNSHHDCQRSESYCESSNTTNYKENRSSSMLLNSDNNTRRSISNGSTSDKRVSFSNNISTKKYKPSQPVSSITKLSRRQQKKLKKLHRNDSLDSHSISSTEENCDRKNSIDLIQSDDLSFSAINQSESSDED